MIGVGHLGRQHARIHAALARERLIDFVGVCDINEDVAKSVARERQTAYTTEWKNLIGKADAVSLAVPTESHAGVACSLLEAGIHVLVEKPIARSLEEADRMIHASKLSGALLQVGHLERFNPALVALKPYVKGPLYFEIHRVGQFSARSLDIDVVLDLMIHDLDVVQWLVGEDVEVTDLRAVGIPILTQRVDAANARLEFASGTVANITASRVGTDKIRKMRFFQPHDYIAVDYATHQASITSLSRPDGSAATPGVHTHFLDVTETEPLRTEILAFLRAIERKEESPVSGTDGRRALALAIRVLEQIDDHVAQSPLIAESKNS